jgi:hypothetical protein
VVWAELENSPAYDRGFTMAHDQAVDFMLRELDTLIGWVDA